MVSAARVVDEVRDLVAAVPDPEIPVLTLADLGILRGVEQDAAGLVTVTLTPTYTGCPATEWIRADVRSRLDAAGHADVEVRVSLAPPWTTDWMTEQGRAKLRDYGIAPPAASCRALARPVACPRCGSRDTREVSRFGSTPCQAQMVCNACLEPFDRFKAI